MGCANSVEDEGKEKNATGVNNTLSITSSCSEGGVDISHFSNNDKLLGVGGFGVVRLVVKNTGLDKDTSYALKSLSKSAVIKRPSGYGAVLTELNALALLNGHPFVCNVKYAFQDDKYLHLCLEVAIGGDMRHHIRMADKYRFSEANAKFYLCQILLAVDACHAASILHRDVKPENLLMCSNGYLKLSDFGVSKVLDNIYECYSTSGTHGYMAPEIYVTGHKHGPPIDWFAVGVTLHEFVSGRRPFEVTRLQSYRHFSRQDMSQGDPLRLDFLHSCQHLSSACKSFISQLLAPLPSHRLGSRQGLKEIKRHEWLCGINWLNLERQLQPAPCCPEPKRFVFSDMKEPETRSAWKKHLDATPLPASQQMFFAKYEFPFVNGNQRLIGGKNNHEFALESEIGRTSLPAQPTSTTSSLASMAKSVASKAKGIMRANLHQQQDHRAHINDPKPSDAQSSQSRLGSNEPQVGLPSPAPATIGHTHVNAGRFEKSSVIGDSVVKNSQSPKTKKLNSASKARQFSYQFPLLEATRPCSPTSQVAPSSAVPLYRHKTPEVDQSVGVGFPVCDKHGVEMTDVKTCATSLPLLPTVSVDKRRAKRWFNFRSCFDGDSQEKGEAWSAHTGSDKVLSGDGRVRAKRKNDSKADEETCSSDSDGERDSKGDPSRRFQSHNLNMRSLNMESHPGTPSSNSGRSRSTAATAAAAAIAHQDPAISGVVSELSEAEASKSFSSSTQSRQKYPEKYTARVKPEGLQLSDVSRRAIDDCSPAMGSFGYAPLEDAPGPGCSDTSAGPGLSEETSVPIEAIAGRKRESGSSPTMTTTRGERLRLRNLPPPQRCDYGSGSRHDDNGDRFWAPPRGSESEDNDAAALKSCRVDRCNDNHNLSQQRHPVAGEPLNYESSSSSSNHFESKYAPADPFESDSAMSLKNGEADYSFPPPPLHFNTEERSAEKNPPKFYEGLEWSGHLQSSASIIDTQASVGEELDTLVDESRLKYGGRQHRMSGSKLFSRGSGSPPLPVEGALQKSGAETKCRDMHTSITSSRRAKGYVSQSPKSNSPAESNDAAVSQRFDKCMEANVGQASWRRHGVPVLQSSSRRQVLLQPVEMTNPAEEREGKYQRSSTAKQLQQRNAR